MKRKVNFGDLQSQKGGMLKKAEQKAQKQQATDEKIDTILEHVQSPKPSKKATRKRSKVGRPKKHEEKLSEPVTLKFTISELEAIKKKAGLVPLATFLRAQLQEKTDIFS